VRVRVWEQVCKRERVCVCVCACKLLKFSNVIRSMANVIAIQNENRAFMNLCLFKFDNKFVFLGYCFCTDTYFDKPFDTASCW
jgi:hypothetical protein